MNFLSFRFLPLSARISAKVAITLRREMVAITIGWLVMIWFVASLFVGSRRTPYDWVAGTVVTKASTTLARNGE